MAVTPSSPTPAGESRRGVGFASAPGPGVPGFDPGRYRFGQITLAATLVLIFVGGLVTSTDAGLSVPDWPLSYGMLFPPMVGRVFFEDLHRKVAGAVAISTLALALWTARREPRRGVRRLAWGALATVLAQAVLGGLTVLLLLPTAVSVAHACLAQTFLCLLVALAYATSREWLVEPPRGLEDGPGVRGAAGFLLGLVYLQLVLGAVMRHLDSRSWSGSRLAIPDFPLALGHVVPPFESAGVAVHFAHRLGALFVLGASVLLARRAVRLGDRRFSRPALAILALVVLQIALGATTVLTGKGVLPATAHVATGAAVLGASAFLALRAFRLLHPSPAGAPAGVTEAATP